MSAEESTFDVLARALLGSAMTLADALRSPLDAAVLLEELGLDPAGVALPPQVAQVVSNVDGLITAWVGADGTLPKPLDTFKAIQGVIDGITQIDWSKLVVVAAASAADMGQKLLRRLLDRLAADWLRREAPRGFAILQALGVVVWQREILAPPTPDEAPRVLPWIEVRWEALPKLLSNPVAHLKDHYGWGTDGFGIRVLVALDDLLRGLRWAAGFVSADAVTLAALGDQLVVQPAQTKVAAGDARFVGEALHTVLDDDTRLRVGVALADVPSELGVAITPYVLGQLVAGATIELNPWLSLRVATEAKLGGNVGLLLSSKAGAPPLRWIGEAKAEGAFSVRAELRPPAEEPAAAGAQRSILLLGETNGSRLTVEGVAISAGVRAEASTASGAGLDVFAELEAKKLQLTLLPPSDGFLKAIFPGEKIEASVSATLGLSSARGVYFRGSAGLVLELPASIALGPIKLEGVRLTLTPKTSATESKVVLDTTTTLSAALGPLWVSVRNLGARATLDLAPNGGSGNLGAADLSIAPRWPDGAGLSIDTPVVKGGGFVSLEPDQGRYFGVLSLELMKTIAIRAIGLVQTKGPELDGSFALLMLLSASFKPGLQLGMGFAVTKVGGLFAMNHTFDAEALRAGVRDGSLKNLFFNDEPEKHADRILKDALRIFPLAKGRFVFGPLLQITWTDLVKLDVGLVLELPDPIKIALIGLLRVEVGSADATLVRVQVAFVGTLDFGEKLLAFDASLFDSKLLWMTLAGDMAVRVGWGPTNAGFLLSLGGFHPSFKPPPELKVPAMRRLSIDMLGSDNPRLRLEVYLAITSNTFQLGGRLDLAATAGPFGVFGELGLDVLFEFDPFHFQVDVYAMLAVRAGSVDVLAIHLAGSLAGPNPWRVKGRAKFTLLLLSFSVELDETFGDPVAEKPLPAVDVLLEAAKALREPSAWAAGSADPGVTLRDRKGEAGLVASPRATLRASQKKAPLGVTVTRVGQAPALRPVKLTATPNGALSEGTTEVRELFARAQFVELSSAEKLSSPSFEELPAGLEVKSEAAQWGGAYELALGHEDIVLDEDDAQELPPASLDIWNKVGRTAREKARRTPVTRAPGRGPKVELGPLTFGLSMKHDLGPSLGGAAASVLGGRATAGLSHSAAVSLQRELTRALPALEIQVIQDLARRTL